jgi:hypothetical protein
MSPLAIELISDYRALVGKFMTYICCKMFGTENFYLQGPSLTSLWTTGSNEGEYCVEDETFSWCSTEVMFSNYDRNGTNFIKNITNKNSTSNRCLSMDFTTASLSLSSCDQKHQFVCEVRCGLAPKFIQ